MSLHCPLKNLQSRQAEGPLQILCVTFGTCVCVWNSGVPDRWGTGFQEGHTRTHAVASHAPLASPGLFWATVTLEGTGSNLATNALLLRHSSTSIYLSNFLRKCGMYGFSSVHQSFKNYWLYGLLYPLRLTFICLYLKQIGLTITTPRQLDKRELKNWQEIF